MKRVRALSIVLFLLSLGIKTSASLSDGFFCTIQSEKVTISLKKTEGFYRCNDTIASLETLIIGVGKDLMKIQTYINQGREVAYWSSLKSEKLHILEKMQLARKNILANIKIFEENLLSKSLHYFILAITPYKIQLQKSLVKISRFTGTVDYSLFHYTENLKQQVATIESLSRVQDFSQLSSLLQTYVYLKKKISGKYE